MPWNNSANGDYITSRPKQRATTVSKPHTNWIATAANQHRIIYSPHRLAMTILFVLAKQVSIATRKDLPMEKSWTNELDLDSTERIVTAEQMELDIAEPSLRPSRLAEYIGQDAAKENLSVYIDAACGRGEMLDHVLLYGPPGLGKTTLAGIIAREMGVNIRITSGPALNIPGDLVSILTNLAPNDLLFIDEIHRLNRVVEESLYSAMEDFAVDLMIGKGPSARSLRMNLPPFTLVGATTRAGQLSSPLRDRFGVLLKLEMYTPEQLAVIVTRSAGILDIPISEDGANEIATRSRGTPRIANRILRRVRDFAEVKGQGKIDREIADFALNALEIDHLGLDKTDRRMLDIIIRNFDGGPVGLETLAATLGEETITLEDVVEPFLMQIGFLARTPRGRITTSLAFEHMKDS